MESKAGYPELHRELKLHLEPMEGFGQMLRHPLLFSVPYFGDQENERLNSLFEYRKQCAEEAKASGNYHLFVFNYERPYRLDALRQIKHAVCDKAFNVLLLEVFVDSENISQNGGLWTQLLDPLTGCDPWNTVHELPEGEFEIYRGSDVRDGFSWTLSLETAKWFANRWGKHQTIWKATVTRDDVIGYYNGRNEQEVILSPYAITDTVEEWHDQNLAVA